MSRKDRAAALTQRRDAVAVIKAVRKTRRLLAKHPFTAKTFDAINGKERGLEQLVGRDILFDCLSEPERLQLRHDINMKLDQSEAQAFEVLRASTEKFLADLRFLNANLVIDPKASKNILGKKQSSIEAFNAFEMKEGALDCERAMSTLEHLEALTADVEETIPGFEHDLEKEESEEYDEEKHKDDDELLEDGPDGSEEDDDDEDDDEDIDLGDDDDEDEGDDDDEVDEDGEKTTTTDLTFICDEQNFAIAARKFTLPTIVCTEGAGYTQVKSAVILDKYQAVMEKYATSLNKLADTFASVECTNEDLLKGSVKLYRKLDRVVALVHKFEPIRLALTKSCEGLLDASKVVAKQEIVDPKL